LREKVSAKLTDEGSRGAGRLAFEGRAERGAKPLIRPPSEATFSHKGRRNLVFWERVFAAAN